MDEERERQVAAGIGGSVRRARGRAGLSTRELAVKADLSQPFLSNIENGRSMPSVATLYKLAVALDVPPSELLPPDDDGIAVVRAGGGVPTHVDEAPGEAMSWLLTGAPGRILEIYRYVIEPGQRVGGWFEHEGEDFLYVTGGLLVAEFASGRAEELRGGDSLWHLGTIPHRWRVGPAEGATLLLVSGRMPERREHPHRPSPSG